MSQQAPRANARLRRYLALVAVAGLAVTVALTVLAEARGELDPWLLLVVTVTALISSLVSLELPLGDRALSMNLAVIGIIVGLALLSTPAVVPAVVVGILIAEVGKRRGAAQVSFNVGATAVATATAVVVVASLGGGPIDVTEPAGLATMALAVLVYGTANLVATGLLLARLDDMTFSLTIRGILVGSLATLAVSGSLGMLVALLLAVTPVALPLLVVPGWIAHRSLADRVSRIVTDLGERDRLERAVEGASDGIALLDGQGIVVLANPAFCARLGVASDELVARPLLGRLADLGGDADGLASLEGVTAALRPDAAQQAVDLRLGDRVFTLACTGLFDTLGNGTGTVVLLLDVTEERETEGLRRDLIARVSHELRTPLTAIIGFVETMHQRDEAMSSADRARYLEVVKRHSLRLDRLVSTLLWSARIERADEGGVAAPVGVADTVREVLHHLPDLSVTDVEVVGDGVAVADPGHLQQVLLHLLANANTYGRAPILVDIQPSPRDGSVTVEVSDAGDGVPSHFLAALFDPFAQASVGTRRTATGLGLGLSIVRSLVEQNAGTIEYRRRQGRTCFQLRLPAADDPAPLPRPLQPVGA